MFSGDASAAVIEVVFYVIIAVLLAAAIWSSVRAVLRAHSAQSWPAAEARIETCYVATVSGPREGPTRYYPVLQYSYVVEGERYSGSLQLSEWNPDRDAAGEAGRAWVGERIHVRYKPEDPAISVWLRQDGAPAGPIVSVPDGSDDSFIDPELNK